MSDLVRPKAALLLSAENPYFTRVFGFRLPPPMIEAEATAMPRALASLVVALIGGVNRNERTIARDHTTLAINSAVHFSSFR